MDFLAFFYNKIENFIQKCSRKVNDIVFDRIAVLIDMRSYLDE
jgi:hypothetical protein